MRHFPCRTIILALFVVAVSAPADVINPGDLLVADGNVFTNLSAGVTRLTPAGVGTVLTSRASPGSPQFDAPSAVVVTPSGNVFVSDVNFGQVFQVNPVTGAQSVLATGHTLGQPMAMTANPDGTLLIADSVGYLGAPTIWQLDPTNAQITKISSYPDNGTLIVIPTGVARAANGMIYVSDINNGVIRVNPTTGAQMLVAPGSGPGSVGQLVGLSFGPDGDLYLAVNIDDNTGLPGVTRLDPNTGVATPISFTNQLIVSETGIAVAADGTIYVTDSQNGIVRVDPLTGNQTAFGSTYIVSPTALTFVPAAVPEPGTLALCGMGVAGLVVVRRRRALAR
jgi:streptogramin lyase